MSDPHGQALIDMRDRCLDMLSDVPGDDLEAKITKIIGDYLYLQSMLQEERSRAERRDECLRDCAELLDYARSGYIGGSGPDTVWDKKRDQVRADIVSLMLAKGET